MNKTADVSEPVNELERLIADLPESGIGPRFKSRRSTQTPHALARRHPPKEQTSVL